MSQRQNHDVCIVTTVHSPLDQRIFEKEARSLLKAGYHVTIVAAHELDNHHVDGIDIITVRPARSRVGRIVAVGWRAFFVALRRHADAYHFHDPEFLLYGLLLKWIERVPVIYDVHEYYKYTLADKHWLPCRLRRCVATVFDLVEKLIARHLSGVVAVNDHLAEQFADHNANVCVMQNYPRLEPFASFSQQVVEERWTRNARTIIYVGTMSESRGVTALLRIIDRLRQHRPDVELILAGRFESCAIEADVKRMILEWRLTRHVKFLGQIPHDDVVEHLIRAAIGIFLLQPVSDRYRWGEPIKYFEYAAAGLPVVISDFPAKRRLIELNRNGVLVDPCDEMAVTQTLLDLLRAPEKLREMGRNGRESFFGKYNWEAIEGRLVGFYQELVGG